MYGDSLGAALSVPLRRLLRVSPQVSPGPRPSAISAATVRPSRHCSKPALTEVTGLASCLVRIILGDDPWEEQSRVSLNVSR